MFISVPGEEKGSIMLHSNKSHPGEMVFFSDQLGQKNDVLLCLNGKITTTTFQQIWSHGIWPLFIQLEEVSMSFHEVMAKSRSALPRQRCRLEYLEWRCSNNRALCIMLAVFQPLGHREQQVNVL